LRLPDFKIIGT